MSSRLFIETNLSYVSYLHEKLLDFCLQTGNNF